MPHRVFLSNHHERDQEYKEQLIRIGESYGIFIDGSVDTGDIDDEDLSDETIRETIRDDYLRDTTVTIVLIGIETKYRKHVDWETYSSMYDGAKNKKSGIIAVNLPDIGVRPVIAPHGTNEKQPVYPDICSWHDDRRRVYFESTYPYMPDRIIDNLVSTEALVSVTNWERIIQPSNLKTLIEVAFRDGEKCKYDMSRPLRRRNGI